MTNKITEEALEKLRSKKSKRLEAEEAIALMKQHTENVEKGVSDTAAEYPFNADIQTLKSASVMFTTGDKLLLQIIEIQQQQIESLSKHLFTVHKKLSIYMDED